MLRQFAKALLPSGSTRYKVAKRVAHKLGIIAPAFVDGRYTDWVASAEPISWTPVRKLAYQPLISIIVPVFNVPEVYLQETVFSVINQTYGNWELLLINASSDATCRAYTEACTQIDERIRLVDISENKGIGENTNQGIAASQGDYLALLDHDDTLAPQALYEVVCALQAKDKPRFIYSDEDKLTPKSEYRYDPHLKSDWSLHLLRQVNYLNHFTVLEKKLVEETGVYRKGFDGAQDYDFYLRLIDKQPMIHHIPKILYHWRAAPTSTAADFSSKKNILEAGIRALQDHLGRNGIAGTVHSMDKQPGYYSISYASDMKFPVAVVLLPSQANQHYAEYVRRTVRILQDEQSGIEVFTNNLKANQKFITAHQDRLTNITSQTTAEYLKQVLSQSKAKAFILIDAAVIWQDNAWIRQLAGYVEQCDDVGLASPLLVDKNAKSIVDAGLVRQGDDLVPLFKGYPVGAHTFFGSTVWTRSVDMISGRVVALSRATVSTYLLQDERSIKDGCAAILANNKQIIMYPHVELRYYGDFNQTVGASVKFSPLLTATHYEFGFPSVIRFDPSGDDNA